MLVAITQYYLITFCNVEIFPYLINEIYRNKIWKYIIIKILPWNFDVGTTNLMTNVAYYNTCIWVFLTTVVKFSVFIEFNFHILQYEDINHQLSKVFKWWKRKCKCINYRIRALASQKTERKMAKRSLCLALREERNLLYNHFRCIIYERKK